MVDVGVVPIEMVLVVVQSIYSITNLLGVNVKHCILLFWAKNAPYINVCYNSTQGTSTKL